MVAECRSVLLMCICVCVCFMLKMRIWKFHHAPSWCILYFGIPRIFPIDLNDRLHSKRFEWIRFLLARVLLCWSFHLQNYCKIALNISTNLNRRIRWILSRQCDEYAQRSRRCLAPWEHLELLDRIVVWNSKRRCFLLKKIIFDLIRNDDKNENLFSSHAWSHSLSSPSISFE